MVGTDVVAATGAAAAGRRRGPCESERQRQAREAAAAEGAWVDGLYYQSMITKHKVRACVRACVRASDHFHRLLSDGLLSCSSLNPTFRLPSSGARTSGCCAPSTIIHPRKQHQ